VPKWKTLKDAIGDMGKPVTLGEARKVRGAIDLNWHVVRQMSEDNKARLRATRPGISRSQLPKRLRPKCHKAIEDGYGNAFTGV
jgi:hypothetical protein